jgi:hypothetical protein
MHLRCGFTSMETERPVRGSRIIMGYAFAELPGERRTTAMVPALEDVAAGVVRASLPYVTCSFR